MHRDERSTNKRTADAVAGQTHNSLSHRTLTGSNLRVIQHSLRSTLGKVSKDPGSLPAGDSDISLQPTVLVTSSTTVPKNLQRLGKPRGHLRKSGTDGSEVSAVTYQPTRLHYRNITRVFNTQRRNKGLSFLQGDHAGFPNLWRFLWMVVIDALRKIGGVTSTVGWGLKAGFPGRPRTSPQPLEVSRDW